MINAPRIVYPHLLSVIAVLLLKRPTLGSGEEYCNTVRQANLAIAKHFLTHLLLILQRSKENRRWVLSLLHHGFFKTHLESDYSPVYLHFSPSGMRYLSCLPTFLTLRNAISLAGWQRWLIGLLMEWPEEGSEGSHVTDLAYRWDYHICKTVQEKQISCFEVKIYCNFETQSMNIELIIKI